MSAEVWYADDIASHRSYAALVGDAKTRTLVVGGGLAGLSTALSLVERGETDIMLVEARHLGAGASGRNGGFVFGGYSLAPYKLLARVGPERARRLMNWTLEGVETVRRRIKRYDIDCRLTEGGVIWADWFHRPGNMDAYRRFLAECYDIHWRWLDPETLRRRTGSRRYGGGLLESAAFHFQPLRYVRGLGRVLAGRGVRIAGTTPVRRLERDAGVWLAATPGGTIRASRVVVATGGYGPWPLPGRFRPVIPVASHAGVTTPLGPGHAHVLPGPEAVYDSRFAFDYYHRVAQDRLLWGGRISVRQPSRRGITARLKRDLLRVYPELTDVDFDWAWSGWMSYARHQMPVLAEAEKGLWYALGFGGHGMAVTALAGEVLAEALAGDRERLNAFAPWPAVRAWDGLGRLAAQSVYTSCQVRDAIRVLVSRR